jgi:hypothetical protein
MPEHEHDALEAALAEAAPAQPGPAGAAPVALGGSFTAAVEALSRPGAGVARAALMRSLQHGHGNRYVQSLLRQAEEEAAPADASAAASSAGGAVPPLEETFVPQEYTDKPDEHLHIAMVGPGEAGEPAPDTAVAAPAVRFVDLGRTGTRRYGDPADGPRHAPRAFTNGGQTGTVAWAGGGGAGAHGNEGVGSVQAQVAPIYDAAANATPPNFDGWVRAATGTIAVTRSYVGVNSGDQGNGHFVTVAAAARINAHEVQHVTSTSGFYATHLAPLELRVAAYRQGGTGVNIGTGGPDAQTKVKNIIKWPESVTAFQNADRTANTPMGPVDTADLASGTYPVDAGPGNVAGTAFQHRVRLPAEANPAP